MWQCLDLTIAETVLAHFQHSRYGNSVVTNVCLLDSFSEPFSAWLEAYGFDLKEERNVLWNTSSYFVRYYMREGGRHCGELKCFGYLTLIFSVPQV